MDNHNFGIYWTLLVQGDFIPLTTTTKLSIRILVYGGHHLYRAVCVLLYTSLQND